MYSIYHFFKNLFDNRSHFMTIKKLKDFPYNTDLISCKNEGVFPDMAIKVN